MKKYILARFLYFSLFNITSLEVIFRNQNSLDRFIKKNPEFSLLGTEIIHLEVL